MVTLHGPHPLASAADALGQRHVKMGEAGLHGRPLRRLLFAAPFSSVRCGYRAALAALVRESGPARTQVAAHFNIFSRETSATEFQFACKTEEPSVY
jgi:hypothetical protein